MQNELEQLSTTLIEIYKRNLTYLKENFPLIYQDIDNLSNNITNGLHQEKYTLEYVDGYFDILNHENNGMYYFKDSYKDADDRKEEVDFSLKSSLDLLRKVENTNKLIFGELYEEVIPIIHFINENIDLEIIEFEKIYKFVFIGTGLGLHIQEINKKLQPYTTLIIEPELEIFRLSLFITDYTIFDKGNRKLFLSIGNDKPSRLQNIHNFAHHHEYMNYNIKHYNLLSSTKYIKDELISYFGTNNVLDFPYKAIIQILDRTVTLMRKKEKFISFIKSRKELILEKKQVLLISAGPSLDNYISWIKQNKSFFTIICVDVIVRKLEKHNIIPDVVVSIDPSPECARFLTTEKENFLENSVIVCMSQSDPKMYSVVSKKNTYFTQGLALKADAGYFGSSPNVGTFSFQMSILLGAKEVYLIGCDAAFNQDNGHRYANDSSHFIEDKISINSDTNVFKMEDTVYVKGNLRETIKTSNDLLAFRNDYEKTIHVLKETFSFNAYNMSDGAYIDGLQPICQNEMDNRVLKFNEKKDSIVNSFDNISETISDISYDNTINSINTIIKNVEKFKKNKFKNKNEFLNLKLELMSWILTQLHTVEDQPFASIFLKYIALSDIYINFILNIKQENLHTPENLKKINIIWCTGIIKIFKDIKKSIQ